MEKTVRHYDKIVLTLIMCLAVLFMATFSPFAQETKAIGLVVSGEIIAIIIAGLAACGITLIATDGFDTLEEYISDMFSQYCTSIGTTPSEAIRGCQSGSNNLGQLLLNNRFVLLIDTFAQWLKLKLNLTNNNTQTIYNTNSVTLSNGNSVPIYEVNERTHNNANGPWWSNSLNYSNTYGLEATTSDNWWTFTTGYKLRVWYTVNDLGNGFWHMQLYSAGDVDIGSTKTWAGSIDIPLKLVFEHNTTGYYNNSWLLASVAPQDAHTAQAPWYLDDNAFQNYFLTGLSIDTGTITIPTEDTNYTDGDGAVLDLDLPWGLSYGDIILSIPEVYEGAGITYDSAEAIESAVEDTADVTNLPAGTIPLNISDFPQFHLVDIWHYVAQWIQDTWVAAGTLMAIVVQEPSPMVNLFYAIVCLAIIFGLIKGLAK